MHAPFDLRKGPLIRGRLIRVGAQEHVLLMTVHHIVFDGWSMGILIRELGALYGAYRAGGSDPLPPLGIQYADYAVWQRHKGQADEIDIINILTPDGRLADDARWKPYAGLKREVARLKVVEDLKAAGLLQKEEPYETQIGHSDRSKNRQKLPVRDTGEAADHHVLRIAGNGGNAADVGGHRDGEQVGHPIAVKSFGDLQN